jgi:hypothetical protein
MRHQQSHVVLKNGSFLTKVPEWSQPPKISKNPRKAEQTL